MDNIDQNELSQIVKQKLENFLSDVFYDEIKVTDIQIGKRFTKYVLNLSLKYLDELTSYKSDIALLTKNVSNIEFSVQNERICIFTENNTFNEKSTSFTSLISGNAYAETNCVLPLTIGFDFFGKPIISDLRNLGQLLCLGSVGSGTETLLENFILGLILKHSQFNLKLMLIEPKNFNLRTFDVFENLPHLLGKKIFKTSEDIISALDAVVDEINNRYEMFSKAGTPNIEIFNSLDLVKNDPSLHLPYVVVFINKFDNVISINKSKIEKSIQIITSRARSCGIYLVLSTEKPTTDTLTKIVLNHIQSKLCFKIKKISSNYISVISGSENLFGHGDMLFLPFGSTEPERVQCGYIEFKDCQILANEISKKYNN